MNDSMTVERGRAAAGPPDLWAGAAYDGDTGCIAVARAMAADFLTRARDRHGLAVSPRAHADAQLVVSELVTNAVKYAGGPCVLNLEIRGPVLEITIWDTDATLPLARAAQPGRIGQHGLEIVFALCDGFEVLREPVGKQIKVRLALGPVSPFDV
jgi:anti-sigma regulatory factor (Ser/Thr protein kinase)